MATLHPKPFFDLRIEPKTKKGTTNKRIDQPKFFHNKDTMPMVSFNISIAFQHAAKNLTCMEMVADFGQFFVNHQGTARWMLEMDSLVLLGSRYQPLLDQIQI